MAETGVIAAGDDATHRYDEAEQKRLTDNLSPIADEIHRGTHSATHLNVDYLRLLHRRLFTDVRGHAGICRGHGWGSEYLNFGPNRSVHRNDVARELDAAFVKINRYVRSFIENPTADDYEMHAMHVAVWAHAEIIRIHPFEDGNGRSSRLLLNSILVRLGLHPVAIEVCKEEYLACLHAYFKEKEIQPLLDLFYRLYDEQMPTTA